VAEHTSDWQTMAAVSRSQPVSPSASPHLPFAPQMFELHSLDCVQSMRFSLAQVSLSALQRPVVHAVLLPFAGQMSWVPSVGSDSPA
jgi:hypothetical protein